MNLREWLIAAGIVIIAGILIDGLRRMRLAKQDSLKMSRDLGGQIEKTPLDDDYNPELPSGGARVLSVGADSADEFDSPPMSAIPEDAKPSVAPVSANLGDPVADTTTAEATQYGSPVEESALGDNVSDIDGERIGAVAEAQPSVEAIPEKSDKTSKLDSPKKKSSRSKRKVAKASAKETEDQQAAASDDHEVVVINVDAKPGKEFSGAAIKQLLEACGMKHGEMSIYHRHEEDLLSPIQFSVANAVEPGYFDTAKLESLSTPGVSFFMSIPGPKDYLLAFKYMHETAKCFADNLHGDLKDENRSVLTSQTIEHYKQRIREFERKQLCKARP